MIWSCINVLIQSRRENKSKSQQNLFLFHLVFISLAPLFSPSSCFVFCFKICCLLCFDSVLKQRRRRWSLRSKKGIFCSRQMTRNAKSMSPAMKKTISPVHLLSYPGTIRPRGLGVIGKCQILCFSISKELIRRVCSNEDSPFLMENSDNLWISWPGLHLRRSVPFTGEVLRHPSPVRSPPYTRDAKTLF